jgi:hypothetical protein
VPGTAPHSYARLLEELADYDFEGVSEQQVREEWIAPLLSVLGYGRGTINRIIYEQHLELAQPLRYPGSSRLKVDYLPTVLGLWLWIIEAKCPQAAGFRATRHLSQAWSYATHPEVNVPLMALSDGRRLSVYDVTQPKWAERPELELTHAELPRHFGEVEAVLGARNVARFVVRRRLAHLERALLAQVDLDVLDEIGTRSPPRSGRSGRGSSKISARSSSTRSASERVTGGSLIVDPVSRSAHRLELALAPAIVRLLLSSGSDSYAAAARRLRALVDPERCLRSRVEAPDLFVRHVTVACRREWAAIEPWEPETLTARAAALEALLPTIEFDRRLHLGPAADPFLEGWQQRDPLKQATYAVVATAQRSASEGGNEVAEAMEALLAPHRERLERAGRQMTDG